MAPEPAPHMGQEELPDMTVVPTVLLVPVFPTKKLAVGFEAYTVLHLWHVTVILKPSSS